MSQLSENGAIRSEPDRVILRGEWGSEIVYDVTWSENIAEFEAAFEIVKGDHMADPDESFYQGVEFMALIRRRSDGRLFGYPYWKPIAKHAETEDVGPNGDDHGFESKFNDDYTEYVDGPYWVWLPVEPFTITGYRIAEPSIPPERQSGYLLDGSPEAVAVVREAHGLPPINPPASGAES